MAVTLLTVTIVLSLIGLIITLLLGSLGGRKLNYIVPILVVCWIIAPIALSVVLLSMTPFITVDDFPYGFYLGWEGVILAGCVIGSLFGLKAGQIWADDNDLSCLKCLLVPISLLTLASLAVLLLF